jgi:site-specific DNA-methyltransferase (adenine-specific)
VVVWVVGDSTIKGSESGTSFKQVLFFKEIGFNLYDTMIYRKQNYVPLTHRRYEQCFEYMFVLSKGNPKTFNPITVATKHPGKIEKNGPARRIQHGKVHSMRCYYSTKATAKEKIAPNIFEYPVGGEKTGHPAIFPLQLATDMIRSWSNANDLIYDPFMGSGTVAVACSQNFRNYIGSEISAEYCEIIKKDYPKFRQS